jgi:hypothetical protein
MQAKLGLIARELTKRRIGPRAICKSYCFYPKCKAYKHSRYLQAFFIYGTTVLALAENIRIINKGTFHLGILPRGDSITTKKPCSFKWMRTANC